MKTYLHEHDDKKDSRGAPRVGARRSLSAFAPRAPRRLDRGIARAAGISQPYVFRLFGTKKELFNASVARCIRETLEIFQRRCRRQRGEEALEAIGQEYVENVISDRTRLKAQLQAYAACDDPEIREVVRNGYGDLVTFVEVSPASRRTGHGFFAHGMLINVIAAMDLQASREPWAERSRAGSRSDRASFFVTNE